MGKFQTSAFQCTFVTYTNPFSKLTGKKEKVLSKFFVAGINYRKTEASLRGLFAISTEQYCALLGLAPQYGINEIFVISTCNRTEIYGFAEDADLLCQLLCTQTVGSHQVFKQMAYIRQGEAAVTHLFNVAAGLDSQILGDYEIVGQLKNAVKFSKTHNCIDVFTGRLINSVLQSSKNIRTHTELSSGTVSVSFAAVQYIRSSFIDPKRKNILLIGTGKIGRNTCKNLVDYLGTTNITLINRTADKATELAIELGLKTAKMDNLEACIDDASIILVATNSTQPVILRSHFKANSAKLIIDLSVPYNVEASVGKIAGITVINVDELSKIKDETLERRKAEVPKARAIINHHLIEFLEWIELRKNAPLLKAIKSKLFAMQSCDMFLNYTSQSTSQIANFGSNEAIQKVINVTAEKMRTQYQGGCNFIQAVNDYMKVANN